jgi:heme exporter protein B
MEFIRQSLVIASKDLLLEFRTRERFVSMLTFAILVAVVFEFATDPLVSKQSIGGTMLWVAILFAGILGLGRSFTMEREQDALVGVLLTPISREALYMGKFMANLVILLGATLFLFLIFALFFQLSLGSAPGGLFLITLLACIGFMAMGTLFSAVTASTRLGDTLLPVLLLPLLIPVVVFAASATQRLLQGRPLDEVVGSVRMLGAFDIIFVIVCALAFGFVVEE